MNRQIIAWALVVVALGACSTTSEDDIGVTAAPATAAPPAVPDGRLTQLETSIAELTERIDVLNERIAHVESAEEESHTRPAAAVTAVRAPFAATAPPPQPPRREPPPPAALPPESSPLRGAMLADSYRNALMLFGKNRFAEARGAFQQVYDSEPTGELADNALYWVGETYYAAANFNQAMKYYRRVVDDFPEQNKAPDAMLKMGLVYVKIGDLLLARNAFEQLMARYPYSTPAAAAKSELKRIKY
jgi:tol-pal system protein YbgF